MKKIKIKTIITVMKNDPTRTLLQLTSLFLLQFSSCHTSKAVSQPPMLCLLDSGVTGCWISWKKPPSMIHTNKIPAIANLTLAGSFMANESVILKNILLPEFHCTHRLDTLQAKLFDQMCHYDMILGRDLMNDLGVVLNFDAKSMEWDKPLWPCVNIP